MSRRLFAIVLLTTGAGSSAVAQTAGTWIGDGTSIALAPAESSAIVTFRCAAGGLIMSTPQKPGTQPEWITVRANNGFAYAVPVSPATAGPDLAGRIAPSLIDLWMSQASTLSVTTPPSGRPAIVVDMVPELAALIAACPSA